MIKLAERVGGSQSFLGVGSDTYVCPTHFKLGKWCLGTHRKPRKNLELHIHPQKSSQNSMPRPPDFYTYFWCLCLPPKMPTLRWFLRMYVSKWKPYAYSMPDVYITFWIWMPHWNYTSKFSMHIWWVLMHIKFRHRCIHHRSRCLFESKVRCIHTHIFFKIDAYIDA